MPPVPQARPGDKPGTQKATEIIHDIAWLQEVLVGLGARTTILSNDGVFREAFPGADHATLVRDGLASLASQGSTPRTETPAVNK